MRVVVGFTDGQGTAEALTSAATGTVANVNDAPTGAVVITGTVAQAQELTADTSAIADADGLGAFGYQWQRGVTDDKGTADTADDSVSWTAIVGETAATYTLAQADVGHRVRVVVGFTDGQGTAEALTSAASGPVADVNDAPTGLPGITGTVVAQAQELTADTSAIADADGLGAFGYQWQRGVTDDKGTADTADDSVSWTAIVGETAATYTLAQADVGHRVRVVVGFTDGQGTAEELTSAASGPVADVNDAPTGLPGITGTVVAQGQELTADTSAIADADGLGAFGYQWQRGVTDDKGTADTADDSVSWTAIVGETAATYTLAQADVGHRVRVVVGFTDGQGTAEELTSAASGPVADVNDAPTGAVTITGTVEQGATLRADTSAIADPDGMPQGGFDFSYQWQREVTVTDSQSGQTTTTWNDIGSATGATYTLVQTDVGQRLRVVVDFADAAGHDESLTSAATGTVRDVTAITMNRVATGPVVIRGALRQGQALAADTDTIADADGEPQGGFDFSYQWQRGVTTTDSPSGPPTTTWSDIQDATLATYDLVQADVGQRVRVVVRFADAAGHAETLTGAATGTVTNVNDPPAGSAVVTGLPAGALQADVSELVDPDGLPADSAAYRYQWQRSTDNGNTWADISGATGSTYGLGSADVGSRFRVVVSFIDGQGTLERLTSASTEAVASRPSLVVADNRAAQVGSVLQSGAGTLGEGDEEVELTAWQWQRRPDEPGSGSARVRRSTPPGDGWVDIEGATAAAYELTEADVGQQVRVVVSGESIERAASLEVQVKDTAPAALEVVWVAPATGGSIAESTDVSATPLKVADLAVHDGDGEAIADLSGLTFALSGRMRTCLR